MRARSRNVAGGSWLALAVVGLWPSSAAAQSVGAGGALGGYGGSSGVAGSGMGGGGAMVIPYGGMTEGFMPGRMGGGSSLSFRPRPTASMGPSRAPLGLSPLSGGMTSGPVGMGRGPGARSSMANSTGSRGGGLLRSRTGGAAMGVMPPTIGYPFRQPPSLIPPAAGTPGMPM